jgi:hypothetical protein
VAGLRASSIALSSDGLRVDVGNPLDLTPPNLKEATSVGFEVRVTADDITRSPVLFGALQEILRELLRTGVSAAIGETLPDGTLKVSLVKVEPPANGKIVLVADAEATQRDGSTVRLQGARVRTTPRASVADRLLLLDAPELVSTFEGFGAKVEMGLPFLRAAGIPLPPDVTLSKIVVDEGAIVCTGAVVLRPIDYARALDTLSELADAYAARSPPPDAVAVDVEAQSEVAERPPPSHGPSPGDRPTAAGSPACPATASSASGADLRSTRGGRHPKRSQR